jgi:hypothetical protein
MDRASAKAILMPFDAAHPLLNRGIELAKLPSDLRQEVDRIVQMKSFKKELAGFLKTYELPHLSQHRSDGWTHFLHLYTKVIEDIPLVLKGSGAPHISQVTVGCELARETRHDPYGNVDMFYKVTWNIQDTKGQSGEVFIINSFSLKDSVTSDDIARHAYALYLARGGEHGHDVDDWLQAERELQASSTIA